ncbi:hypothetical protein ACQ4PT_042727 [Festuca glaucescens]
MSSLLRRATLARVAVSAFSTTSARYSSYPCPLPPIFFGSSTPVALGHLGLARAHRGLGELNSLLTREALFLDATHVLAAGALGHKPYSGEMIRQLRDEIREIIAKDESERRAEEVQEMILALALVDAEDGRFVHALNALDRLANERPSDPRPRICASVICCFAGLPEEGKEFLVGIPDDILQENQVYHRRAVMAATLGGAPCAIAGLEGLVASMAFKSINSALEAKYLDGDISLFKKVVFSGLLWRVVASKLKGQVLAGDASPPRCDRKEPLFPVLRGACVNASQALQSAVLLRAHPLSGERLRKERREAERDLARAVEEGDGPAAGDLRLLLALFAARDGRFDDALQLYEEVARDDPVDPRPHTLARMLCGVVGGRKEFSRWNASFQRLVPGSIPTELLALQDEVVVAAALGGVLHENAGDEGMPSAVKRISRLAVFSAWRTADAELAGALLRDKMSIVKKMQVRLARGLLSAGTRSVLKGMNAKVLEKQEKEHKEKV